MIILIMLCSCEKNKINPDPAIAIWGKWEIIEIGNYPNMEAYPAKEYIEYLPDSIIGIYNYDTKEYKYSNYKYWIDSLYYESIDYEEGRELVIERYYKFYDDKLRLDYKNMIAMHQTAIYKRVK